MKPWADLTDAQRLWVLLNRAEAEGVHSWDAETQIRSKNAPSRAKDIASKGVAIYKRVERRNGRPGVRWWLDGWEPDDAVPVPPHGADLGSGLSPRAAVDLSAEPYVLRRDYSDEGDKLGWQERAA